MVQLWLRGWSQGRLISSAPEPVQQSDLDSLQAPPTVDFEHARRHLTYQVSTPAVTSGPGEIMNVMYEHCAGLDVHKKTVVACVLTPQGAGDAYLWHDGRRFSGPFGLAAGVWLHPCRHGEHGRLLKPVFNSLEGTFKVLLVNAQHVKAGSDRKTDVKDAAWLAKLMCYGLLID